jgi:hypothetical protein
MVEDKTISAHFGLPFSESWHSNVRLVLDDVADVKERQRWSAAFSSTRQAWGDAFEATEGTGLTCRSWPSPTRI